MDFSRTPIGQGWEFAFLLLKLHMDVRDLLVFLFGLVLRMPRMLLGELHRVKPGGRHEHGGLGEI